MPAEKNVSEVLKELFRRGGLTRAVRRARLVVLWPQIAGPKLSRFTRARSFRDGVLYVDTTDSETAMHLSLQRERFLQAFAAAGNRELKDIRFVPGRIEAPEPEAAGLPAEPDPQDVAALADSLAGLELPGEVARAALAAGEGIALTRTRLRSLGWTPCEVCTVLSEGPGLCLTCDRYSRESGTLRAAHQLQNNPAAAVAWLTPEQRSVAAWLARGSLHAQLLRLLPQVLADERLRPQLELLAANWLELKHGRPVAELPDSAWLELPAGVQRVLGRS